MVVASPAAALEAEEEGRFSKPLARFGREQVSKKRTRSNCFSRNPLLSKLFPCPANAGSLPHILIGSAKRARECYVIRACGPA